MDLSENESKLENTQKAESQEVDDLVRENLNYEKNSKPVPQELDSEKLEEEKVDSDPISENKPYVSLSEETKNPDENGVSTAILDYVSMGIDSMSDENGGSPILGNAVSEGNAPVLDEENDIPCVVIGSVSNITEETIFPSDGNPVESSGVVDLVSNKIETNAPQSEDVRGVQVDNGGEDSKNMPEIPQSTENQVYIAVTPRLQQRTTWMGCCGLFEVMKRSDL
ncbi:hypothetical protein Acr_00g0095720 [Actinidia rufa]|uniref:Uncharacterized protein n=1 Tax=Actinidia rufa TaxID=165716 RepID=A0A7J0E0V0_9ERIC|nr:hypothetical protein Acr_00g0095720 [Actinidia rufa]